MIESLYGRLIAAALTVVLLFGGGWLSRGWYEASAREKQAIVQARTDNAINDKRVVVAQDYTQRLTQIETAYAMPYWWQFVVRGQPELADVDIGPDGLCIWKAWNAATPAESCADGEGTHAAADSGQRPTGGSDGKPSRQR